ncbi:hypothetical protein AAFF_G00395050 [Aldrovandia affinis]|uniref:Uncharacterized protein n=1 Tax=Aldrovandia affinis TaxID=143900 RepID=A0AAD7WKU5_9TELE|nr:hypothetical protein AAFF_G00395050 [Aldrovandia affinis]
MKELRRTEISSPRVEFRAELRSSVASLQATIATQVQHLQEVETPLSEVEGRLTTVESQISLVTAENKGLKLKIDDLENCSRRMNLRVIAIPEGEERPKLFGGGGQYPEGILVNEM